MVYNLFQSYSIQRKKNHRLKFCSDLAAIVDTNPLNTYLTDKCTSKQDNYFLEYNHRLGIIQL